MTAVQLGVPGTMAFHFVAGVADPGHPRPSGVGDAGYGKGADNYRSPNELRFSRKNGHAPALPRLVRVAAEAAR